LRASRWGCGVLAFIALGLATLTWGPIDAAGQAGTVLVRLPSAAYDSEGIEAKRVSDYGSFVWLEVSADQLPVLEARNLSYELGEPTISLNGLEFDPLKEEPQLPANLRAQPKANEPGLYLVQLVAPPQDRWVQGLANAGLTILQYYPHNTYLVWGTQSQVNQLSDRSYRRWSGLLQPAFKISPNLARFQGRIDHVAVTFYNSSRAEAADRAAVERTLADLASLGASTVQSYPADPEGVFSTAIVSLDSSRLAEVARLTNVWSLDYAPPEPGLDDEMATQIVAGSYPAGIPVTGYYDWLAAKGVSGEGIIWAHVDTGLAGTHPDITGRVAAYVTYLGAPPANTDPNGHGSHTAGAIFGDGRSGTGLVDPNGFYWGTGVAPGAGLVVQNVLEGLLWPPAGGWQAISRDSVINGAIGSSNSWYTGLGDSQGYSTAARSYDLMVRDANWDTHATAEPIITVFSAGNAGGGCGSVPCYTSMTDPKEAKNLISVGASTNYNRAGSGVRDLAYFSSRGPAQDGRLLPTLVAPGSQTASFNGSGVTCGSPVSGSAAAYYNYCSGTSMAAPFVSGAATLIAEWWAQEGRGTPSPAMVKALLVNGAVDMAGGDNGFGTPIAHRPNADQGWGLVNLDAVIHPDISVYYHDQGSLLTDTGQTWQATLVVADPGQPLKVTLAWSDAAAAVGASPALVNDLDLIVVHDGNSFYGNQFSNGWSESGGSPDRLNNLENVYIQNPGQSVQITVSAASIAGDGVPYNGDTTDQDFALVCWNCVPRGFTLQAKPDSLAVCVPQTVTSTLEIGQVLDYSHDISLQVLDVPAGVSASLAPALVAPPGDSLLTLEAGPAAADGHYSLIVSGMGEVTNTRSTKLDLRLASARPEALTLSTPLDRAVGVAAEGVTLNWEPLAQAWTYRLQLGTEDGFSNPVVDVTGISANTYELASPLEPATCYFWRAMGGNACGAGEWAVPSRFATSVYGIRFSDDLEWGDGKWSHLAVEGADGWQLSTAQSHSPAHAWFVPDADTVTDSRLWNVTPLELDPGSKLSFWHRYQFEGLLWDGGVLEISVDGGPWSDLGPFIIANGYNGILAVSSGNPLGGREAWVGDLAAWTRVEVDLSSFAGHGVQMRWRLGCDGSVSDVGWYIDDVEVGGLLSPVAWLQVDSPVELGKPIDLSAGVTAGVPPLTYTWDLGGPGYGVDLATATPVFTYTQVGTYTVAVTMENHCGLERARNQVRVLCHPPEVEISMPRLAAVGQPLHAGAEVTGTGALDYKWDFGGPGSGAGLDSLSPVYTYTLPGDYVVRLTVEGPCGSTTVTEPVQILAEMFLNYWPIVLKQAGP
jgi:hypothetical protein